MSATPPGWYDDGHGAQRWWDGIRWTADVQPAAVVPAGTSAPVSYPSLPSAAPKSRLWILWTVLGVVALGAVITAIIAIPMALVGLSGSAEGAEPGGAAPAESDGAAAVATVELYDEAWQQVDCEKYFAATTEAFRDELELPDCATFERDAQDFADTTDDYRLEVTGVVQDADVITVSTSETGTTRVDDQGEPLDTPEAFEDLWDYYLIQSGEGWLIDDAGTE